MSNIGSNLTIKNCEVNKFNYTSFQGCCTYLYSYGVWLSGVQDIAVRNNRFTNDSYGIYGTNILGALAVNNSFTNIDNALYFISINNSIIANNSGGPISIGGQNSRNNTVNNNTGITSTNSKCLDFTALNDSIISNNVGTSCGGGVLGLGSIAWNNTVVNNTGTAPSSGYGYQLYGSLYNTFSNNVINGNGVDTIFGSGSYNTFSNNVITNSRFAVRDTGLCNSNIYRNNTFSTSTRYVMSIEGCSNLSITNNSFSGGTIGGILLCGSSSSDNNISSNTIASSGVGIIVGKGVYDCANSGDPNNTRIVDNVITGSTTQDCCVA